MDAAGRYRKPENWSHCPAVHPFSLSAFGYAFNSNLSGKKVTAIANPAATPMLYDSTNLARNASDPVTSLPEPPRHGAGNNLGYADGHARWSGHPATAPQPRPDGG
jgi:prepilin-type processing-associated H-X9-DG protein